MNATDSAPVAAEPAVAWWATGLPLICFTLFSWASVPLFLRTISVDWQLDPFAANAWRYGISAAFWLPFLFFAWRSGNLPKRLFVLAAVPVVFNIFGQSFFAWGPTLLDPGFFSFVFRVQVIFVTLGAYFLFPEERDTLRSPIYWLGLLAVVCGSVGLVLFADRQFQNVSTVGILVALASGILFAGYGMSVRYFVSGYPPIVAFGVICQFTAIGAIITGFIAGPQKMAAALDFSPWQWFILVASAFIGIAISHVTYYASIKRLGVSVSMGIIQLQPVITAIGSAFLFNERLLPVQWLAGLVGVIGAMFMLRAGRRKPTDALAK